MSETTDEIWILREAAKPSGFIPHAKSAAEFAKSLENRGWLRSLDNAPVWGITDKGRAELTRLEAST